MFGSTVIAAVGEADQQMLFATQEGKNLPQAWLSAVELSMVLK